MKLCPETLASNSTTGWAPAGHPAEPAEHLTLRVWLVDDDDSLRELLADLLNRHARIFCPRQFSSTEGALEALGRETPPDVVLLDINLRGESGLDAIGPLKALAPSLRVLMLTTFFDGTDERRARKEGASGFLLKSYDLEEIVQAIQTACKTPASAQHFSGANVYANSKPKRAELAGFTPPANPTVAPKTFSLFRSLIAKLTL